MDTSDTAVLERAERTDGPTDHALVRAVRRGDDRAFETLYTRYQRRVAGYVYGMVKDYGRAEDITQEVFVSALRRMRETERPIAFKPWIYEIAKNACIDAFRRGRHTEEVSFDADDRLSPADYGRLVATGPSPDSAVDTKQDLDHLCGAFGGLSDTHHQILVMRELEGLSYKDIGDRMGMSRPAVESTLFRARKRLGEEYDELASGARCLRVQTIIADSEGARLGLRDKRKLARHVSHCQPCRRLAANAGLDIAIPVRTRVAEKIAGLLPLPAFLRLRRGGGGDAATAAGGSGGGPGWTAHLPAFAEPLQSGWGKAAAGLTALLVAGAGAGVTTTMTGDKRDERGTDARPAAVQEPAGDSGGTAPARAPVSTIPASTDRRETRKSSGSRKAGKVRRKAAAGGSGTSGSKSLGGAGTERANTPASDTTAPDRASGGGTDERAGGSRSGDGGGDTSNPGSTPPRDPDGSSPSQPPADGGGGGGGTAQQPIQQAVNNVDTTVQNATNNLGNTVQQAGQDVQKVLTDPQNLLPNVADTANNALTNVGGTVNQALGDAGKLVGDLLKPKPNG
jgi:RNA polymerase sigma factor (sigma-70 family)